MRVLVVSHLALPHVGGVENLVDLEVRALAAAGHEVRLLTSDGTGAGRAPAGDVVRVPASHLLERRAGIPYPLFGPALLAALWREVGWADVVHAHGFLFQNTAAALVVARLQRKPALLTDHGGIQKFGSRAATLAARFGAESVGRLSATIATRTLAYNSRIVATLNRLGRRRDTAFLANPVDPAVFAPPTTEQRAAARAALGWPADRPKVLFAGRLIAAKGVPLLLAAADPAFDLVFCGPGDVGLLGGPRPGVEYLPPRPQSELVRVYHAADALALPAEVREGFPLVVQEAAACGLPAVLGWDPGFEPYRGVPGLVFTTRTPDAVRAALRSAVAAGTRTRDHATDPPFPPPDVWVRALLDLFPAPRRAAR